MSEPGHAEALARRRLSTGLVLAVLGSVAFSGKAIIIKVAYGYSVDAVTLLALRMLFALPLFLWMGWRGGQGRTALSGRDWRGIAALGLVGYYLASLFDFIGLRYISASLERLVLYLNPTLVLVLGWLLHRQRISRLQLIAMAVSYSGIVLMFAHEAGLQGEGTAFGVLMVFLSALGYAWYLVQSGRMVHAVGSLRLVGLASTVASVLCIGQFLILRPMPLQAVAVPVLWLSLVNAMLCTALPVLMVMMAVERIGPALTAQTGMVGPLATLVMAVVLLAEPLNGWVLAGTTLVLAGVYMVTRQRSG